MQSDVVAKLGLQDPCLPVGHTEVLHPADIAAMRADVCFDGFLDELLDERGCGSGADDPTFTDAYHNPCTAWTGYYCDESVSAGLGKPYTKEELLDIREHCPHSCSEPSFFSLLFFLVPRTKRLYPPHSRSMRPPSFGFRLHPPGVANRTVTVVADQLHPPTPPPFFVHPPYSPAVDPSLAHPALLSLSLDVFTLPPTHPPGLSLSLCVCPSGVSRPKC